MRPHVFMFWFAACVGSAIGQPASDVQPPRLTLKSAIASALERNKSLKVEAFSRSISRAHLLAARGRFDPALVLRRDHGQDRIPILANSPSGDAERTDDYSIALQGLTPWGLSYSLGGSAQNHRGTFNAFGNNYRTFGGIELNQPLLRGFGFGANLYEVRVAKADRTISDWDFRATAIVTVTRVVIAYSDLALAHENLRIARRARDLVANLAGSNERRFRAGTMSESDVLQARAQAAQREEAILFAQRAVRDNDNALRRLIGEETFSLTGPLLEIDPPPVTDLTVNVADDLSAAYAKRPDYQSARLEVGKRRASDSFARNQRLPRVDVVGSYGYAGLDPDFSASRRMVADREHRAYSAGVVLTVPLTFAEGRGKARAARLHMQQGQADLERLAQDIALSVTQAAGQIETTRQRVTATRTAYELASQALAGELKKLQAGTTTTFVVLNLQTTLTTIESNLSRAQADERRAQAIYEQELGATLERHGIELVH